MQNMEAAHRGPTCERFEFVISVLMTEILTINGVKK